MTTIIVLMILTGISINAIVGKNSVVGRAQDASVTADMSKVIEDAQMAYTDVYAERTSEFGKDATIKLEHVVAKLRDAYRIQ